VAVVLWLIVSFLIPSHSSDCAARQGASAHLLSQLDQAVESCRIDFGVYPPGDGSGSRTLVEWLRRTSPKRMRYFEFPPDLVTSSGDVINPVHAETEVIRYRLPGVHRPKKFDLWARDCKDNPEGLNNW